MQKLQRTVFWQNLNQPGTEYCRLSSHDNGWQLVGTVLLAQDDHPLQVHYQVVCNHLWQTRTVSVTLEIESGNHTLDMIVDKGHRWWVDYNGTYEELTHLRGCVDVDLEITPATNTLPIRRKVLAIGDSAEFNAAWVRFPGLEIKALSQRYTRLAEHRYRYESGDGTFTTEIDVDAMGLVTYYPDCWRQIMEK